MNVAFALYKSNLRKVLIQCPRCHVTTDEESGTVETIFLPDDPVETRAGAEGIVGMANAT